MLRTIMDTPMTTAATPRPDQNRRLPRRQVLFLGALLCGFGMPYGYAADDGAPTTPPVAIRQGHSAAYYGIEPLQRQSSIRSVLAAGGLDRPHSTPSVADKIILLALRMYNGGGGTPSDLIRPQADVKHSFEQERASQKGQGLD
ncbi:hypothetical protein [Sinimarinibacterium sp. NLF-5-8]|uniref:hypothetical protein n=1 Tax=Sinimarinibacterium sp. NLF-5-8 TaxID=2698684 RepID=UPI00137C300D|nr:hypothetical protein [Sinimarinibacterium sp. NLF-5-8]QHS09374.1 hypothetical protein GT972_03860 [Sinimarinibacterium sp. NLF-5-8]